MNGEALKVGKRFQHLQIVLVAALSGAIEFYSFVIFIFLSPVIAQLFFPPGTSASVAWLQTIGIYYSGYLARPLGGIVIAHFGDLFGRKRAVVFSVLLMSLSTLAIAVTPTHHAIGGAAPLLLIVFRMLQGAAIGAEVPGAWTLVSEHIPERGIGLACGIVCSGLGVGILSATLTVALLNLLLSPVQMLNYGWRIPFVISGGLGVIVFYLRRWLRESPGFKGPDQRLLVVEVPLMRVLQRHREGVLLSMVLTWILASVILITALLTPVLLQQSHGYDSATALGLTSFGLVFHVVGCALSGWLLDQTTPAWHLICGGALFCSCAIAFYGNMGGEVEIVACFYAAMCLASGVVTAVPCGMVRLFPSEVRFSGISFSYNTAYACSGAVATAFAASAVLTRTMICTFYFVLIVAIAIAVGAYLRRLP